MMSKYTVENLLREPTEIYPCLVLLTVSLLVLSYPGVFLIDMPTAKLMALVLSVFAFVRAYQAYKVIRYQKRLLKMPYYALATKEVPVSMKNLFVGKGFRWMPRHTQRLNQIREVKNEKYRTPGKLFQWARSIEEKYPQSRLARYLSSPSVFNPVKPLPPVFGSPFLHGLGGEDKPIYIPQAVRGGHTFVLGTTGVGKTRCSSILINQDIRNGQAVIVVDPKGDKDLVRDMYSACKAANRLDDFNIVHLGYPELSATYNPLKNYDQITEIATRLTGAIDAEGEGKQFAAFAWQYVDVVAKGLCEVGKTATYKQIAFYIKRLDSLLMLYADKIMPVRDSGYLYGVESIIAEHNSKVDKNGNPLPEMERKTAVIKYIKQYISNQFEKGNPDELQDDLLPILYEAAVIDKQYYDKIIASVGPVLAEINGSSASGIFSVENSDIELMDVIKHRKVLYIGLDSLTNANVAQAVGKAILSDLVSTAGKIYKESDGNYKLNLHCDELSEFIQDSFIKILNKARGAGFQVTAYAQTKQDLEVALGSKAMAEVTEGNLNTIIMLRVITEETTKVLINMLPKVDVTSHTQVSMVNDTPHGEDNVYFTTTNEDRVQTKSVPMIEACDIRDLPIGQAFLLVNGGELYKIRLPLPVNDGLAPDDVMQIMHEINGKEQ